MTTSRDLFRTEAGRPARTISDLERLEDLRAKGTLSDEEFEAEKRRILSQVADRDLARPIHFGSMPKRHEDDVATDDLVDETPISDAKLEEALELTSGERLVRKLVRGSPMHLVELLSKLPLNSSIERKKLDEKLVEVAYRHARFLFRPRNAFAWTAPP